MKTTPTDGDSITKESKGIFSFEEMQDHLDDSGQEVYGNILEYMQEIGRIDELKVMKFQKLVAEKGKAYANQYMEKMYKETKNWLNEHGFTLQKRKDILKLMHEGDTVRDILGILNYNELKEYIIKSFNDFLDQSETKSGTDQYNDFAKKRNEQQAFQKRMSEFTKKHMDDLLKISYSGAITMLLSINDNMTKTELLDGLAKKQGKERDKADKDISKMIEGGMIKEEGGKLSLIY